MSLLWSVAFLVACKSMPPTLLSSPTPADRVERPIVVSEEHLQVLAEGPRYIGLIRNVSGETQGSITLHVETVDSNGGVVATEAIHPLLPILAPNLVSPFVLDLKDTNTFGEVTYRIGKVESESVNTSTSIGLEIIGLKVFQVGSDTAEVVGELKNTGSVPIQVEELAGVAFGGKGELLDSTLANVGRQVILPGGRGPFRMSFNTLQESLTVQIYPLARPSQLTTSPAAEIYVVGSPVGFVDPSGRYHLVGEIVNRGDQSALVWLTGALLSSTGEILDAANTTVPLFVLAPREHMPFDFDDFPIASGIPAAGSKVAKYSIQVNLLNSQEANLTPIFLSVSQSQLRGTAGSLYATVKVTNSSLSETRGAVLVATAKNRAGQVVGAGNSVFFQALKIGGTVELAVPLSVDPDEMLEDLTLEVVVQALP